MKSVIILFLEGKPYCVCANVAIGARLAKALQSANFSVRLLEYLVIDESNIVDIIKADVEDTVAQTWLLEHVCNIEAPIIEPKEREKVD